LAVVGLVVGVFGLNPRNGRWRIDRLFFCQAVAVGWLSAMVANGEGRCVEMFSRERALA